jgi:hypothetical protein
MKRIYTVIGGIMLTASVFAQTPEKMSYQAVIRDASNNLTTNQSVGMQISILQGSSTGTAVYVETQNPTSNVNGLVSLEIGTGTIISGDFTTIDWANDTYFIKTETDPTGGTNYTITGTSQLLSVPYALHAKTAESITGTVNYTETDPVFGASIANGITAADTANWNNHTIDTDTNIDSTGIAGLGFVAGPHTIDTDTQLDSTDIANMGYVAPVGFSPYTITGEIPITGAGTYIINYGSGYKGIGIISCSIDQVPNGIWNSGGTISFSVNSNTQDNLQNVVEYQLYSGGNIQAELRPLNGANYDNVGANIDGRVEVVVTSISQPSILRWSVTIFQ